MTDEWQTAHDAESRRDVEKNWHDPNAVRAATWFTAVVVVIALAVMGAAILWSVASGQDECADAAFAVCQSPQRYILAMAPTAIFLAGGIAAFVRAFRVWRTGGAWPIWQGAGWILFVLSVLYLGLSSPALIVD